MPHSPLVSKIRCHNPNKNKSRVCNRNYVIYIATREGVDLTNIESKIETLDDSGITEESANDLYARYIAERPGSNGLFGNIDCSDINQVGNSLADLTAQGKTIYRGIVSLSEADAIDLGYNQKEAWVNFMRSTLPDVADVFHVPIDKLQWCAAVHMEQKHPHCHYMFWSSDDHVTDPYIHVSKQDKCREILSKEVFRAEREQEIINKTLQRDLLLDLGKDILNENTDQIIKNESQIMGRINNEILGEYGEKLLSLSAQLPDHGKLQYKLLQPEIKEKVDAFVNDVLQQSELKKQYNKYLQSVDKISLTYSASHSHMNTNRSIADEDIRKRLANVVLKNCNTLIRDQAIFDKYINRAEYLAENEVSSDQSSDLNKYDDNSYPDIDPEYDETDFIYDYNKSYKKALNLIYDPEQRDMKAAVNILISQSAQNNVLACLELGKLYASELVPGISGETSKSLSQEYYQKAYRGLMVLEKQEPKAAYEYKIGKLLEKGNGIQQDYKEAQKYYEKASCTGYKYAQYALGSMYLHENIEAFTKENRSDLINTGLHYIKQSADQNFAYAAYTYANTSESESFMQIGEDELNNYYSAALSGFQRMLAERRDDNLLYRIGTMYYAGQGTPADQEAALEYFKEAAELKNVNAQYALGKTYADPESGHYNLQEAIIYFNLAEAQGNTFASYDLGKIYLNYEETLYDPEKGMKYLDTAIQSGNKYALAKKGNIYLWGKHPGIEKDVQRGLVLLQEAAEKGNEYAQTSIDIYNDIQINQGINLLVRTGYRCFRSIFSSLVQSRNRQDELKLFLDKSKEARKAALTRAGKYKDVDE